MSNFCGAQPPTTVKFSNELQTSCNQISCEQLRLSNFKPAANKLQTSCDFFLCQVFKAAAKI
jgi:hypothetical protein